MLSWDFVVLFYIVLYIFKSRAPLFYFPNPREIDLNTAKTIPTVLVFIYLFPFLNKLPSITLERSWEKTAQVMFPIIVTSLSWMSSRMSYPKTPVAAFTALDLPYLLRSYALMAFVTSTTHIIFIANFLQQQFAWTGSSRALFLAGADIKLQPLSVFIVIWCLFTAWDMRRVNLAGRLCLKVIWLIMVVVSLLLGPTTLLVGTWRWREIELETARKIR